MHAGLAGAQLVPLNPAAPVALPPRIAPTLPPITPRIVKIPEGTEVRDALAEKLSSTTSAEGDQFSVITDEEINLPDGKVIPAGYTGKGEVINVSKAGMVGKSGQLNIRMD
jgi:hypothetical protein